MVSRPVYFFILFVSIVCSLVIKASREDYFGVSPLLDMILGSGLSFLCVAGLTCVQPCFSHKHTDIGYLKWVVGVSIGALGWELEQVFMQSMYFDWYDIGAIFIAAGVMARLRPKKNEAKFNRDPKVLAEKNL
jgi:hypothetical protein